MIQSWWRSFVKYFTHLWTGKCEIYRICAEKFDSLTTPWKLSISLKKSKMLAEYSKIVFTTSLAFDKTDYLNLILNVKKIDQYNNFNHLVVESIKLSLDHIHFVNTFIIYCESKTTAKFKYGDPNHFSYLESLWNNLKPNVRREPYKFRSPVEHEAAGDSAPHMSSDWSELGFQGVDPSSDFRSMGMLGLLQLQYFSQNHTIDALEVLLDSNHPRRFYPFAATGINITNFVVSMLYERRLDRLIYSVYKANIMKTNLSPPTQSGSSYESDKNSESAISYAFQELHELYVSVYIVFYTLWKARDPPNIMSFKDIFDEVRKTFQRLYPRLDDC